MDTLPGGVPRTVSQVACYDRPVCHLPQQQASGVLLSGGGSSSGGGGCDVTAVGSSSGGRVSSVWPHSAPSGQGPSVSGSGADSSGSVLASEALVSGPPGGGTGSSSVPLRSASSATFSSLPSQFSHCERSARPLGNSAPVAHQLARSRRSSARRNYQSKWLTYRAWCHRHGRSVSSPTIPKVADFLLYLRRFLHLSYSSMASYRSMLSATFCFILPDISFHPVLHDLLRSFRIERPLPSSRVPPWDLSLVLSLLRGAPFEPLVSCSLRDLTRKLLFLLSLATARRVGELQAVAADVSFSRGDAFLSYLSEFRAKLESEARPLPRSF